MSKISIEEMRDAQEFISYNKWSVPYTNCIAYALGCPISDPKRETWNDLLSGNPEKKLYDILMILELNPRRIHDTSELRNDEYGIVLYNYFYKEHRSFCGCEWTEDVEECHLVRVELDGTWTHKFGWDYEPSVTTPQEIHDIILCDDGEDVSPSCFFAIRKP